MAKQKALLLLPALYHMLWGGGIGDAKTQAHRNECSNDIGMDAQIITIDMRPKCYYYKNTLNFKLFSHWGGTGIYNNYTELNFFLVNTFNEILHIEESSLRVGEFNNLSVCEMHVIEAVCNANEGGADNRASDVARALRISAGTLTTTVTLLEKKGYLVRVKDTQDKRIIRLNATEKGKRANQVHQSFHHQMVTNVMETLNNEEIDVLVKGLKNLKTFFDSKK